MPRVLMGVIGGVVGTALFLLVILVRRLMFRRRMKRLYYELEGRWKTTGSPAYWGSITSEEED